MEMKIKSQVQFNDDLSQRSNIVSGDSLSNSFAKIHHDLNDYEIAANISANDRPKNLLYIHDILSDSVSTATEEILGYPLEVGTYVYSAEIYTVQNPSVANVTKIEFLGADGNTVVGTCNIACDTKKEEHINVTLSDEAYYIKYYRDTYSSETVGYLKTSKQMICLPNVYAAFPEYTMYAPSLGETFLEVEDSVKTYDVQDTYDSSSYKAISGKGVAAALGTLDVSSVGGTGKVISAISETDGKISATEATMDTTPIANSTAPVTSGGVAASQASQDAEIAWNVNQGVKNLFNINATPVKYHTTSTLTDGVLSGTSNGDWASYNVPVNLPAGDYIFSAVISDFSRDSGAGEGTIRIRITNSISGGTTIGTTNITGNGAISIPFSWSGGQFYVQYSFNFSSTGSYVNTFTASNSMIRPASITDSTFQPYSLPNPTLTPAAIKAVDDGAKNIADFTSATKTTYTTATFHGVTITRNGDIFTISGTSDTNDNAFFNIYYEGSTTTKIIPPGNWVALIENYTGDVVKDIAVQIAAPVVPSVKPYGTPVKFSLSGSESGNWLRVNIRPSTTYNGSFRLMICTAADWAVSQKFVPYCPTNRELYESDKVIDISSEVTAETGYTVESTTHLYYQNKQVFGTVAIAINSGSYASSLTAIAKLPVEYAPAKQYLSACGFSTDQWALTNIGYAFIQSANASSAAQRGQISVKSSTANLTHMILNVCYPTEIDSILPATS